MKDGIVRDISTFSETGEEKKERKELENKNKLMIA